MVKITGINWLLFVLKKEIKKWTRQKFVTKIIRF